MRTRAYVCNIYSAIRKYKHKILWSIDDWKWCSEHVCVCVYMYVCVHICICSVCMCMYVLILWQCDFDIDDSNTRSYIYTHTYTHYIIYKHTYIYTHTYTHVHIIIYMLCNVLCVWCMCVCVWCDVDIADVVVKMMLMTFGSSYTNTCKNSAQWVRRQHIT